MKQRAPALANSPTFQQLWDALGSKLVETAQEHLLYTQEVRGSSLLATIIGGLDATGFGIYLCNILYSVNKYSIAPFNT